jgi:hypothetical protein
MAQPPKKLGTFRSILEDHPKHVNAIGMISIENANLDLMFGVFLARVLGVPAEIGQALYLTPKSAMGRIEMIENVGKLAFPIHRTDDLDPEPRAALESTNVIRLKDVQRVMALTKRARSIINKRHSIIHDAWGLQQDTSEVARRPLPIKLDAIPQPVSLHSLTEIIRDIRAAIDDVRELAREFSWRWDQKRRALAQSQSKNPPQIPGSLRRKKRSPKPRSPKKKRQPRSSPE